MAALVLIKEKKDRSLRLCIYYHGLNAVCIKNVYLLPLMKNMLAYLANRKMFTKWDLQEAYYQVRI